MQNKKVDWAICTATPFLHSSLYFLPVLSELKPQQTGTGLLLRYGEVATTSGSTISLRDGVTSNSALFESVVVGANPAPAANFRPVVK